MISCADSRVIPESITQSGPGELFVCRNAGNIVPPFSTANGGVSSAIEYAVVALGVRDIILCGHSDCGAMKGSVIIGGILVVLQDLLVGVALGLALSILEILPYVRRKLAVERLEDTETVHLSPGGVATCKDVPALLNLLETLLADRKVRIAGEDLHYLDHTCAKTLREWLKRQKKVGRVIEIQHPPTGRHPRLTPIFERLSAEIA